MEQQDHHHTLPQSTPFEFKAIQREYATFLLLFIASLRFVSSCDYSKVVNENPRHLCIPLNVNAKIARARKSEQWSSVGEKESGEQQEKNELSQ